MKLMLNTSEIDLLLSVNETGWCTLHLTRNGAKHELGADSVGVVQRCLLSALAGGPPGEPRATIRSMRVTCVLNLHVQPWSIYVGSMDDRRHLFFRNREEGTTIETVLSNAECERWRHAIQDFYLAALPSQRPSFEPTTEAAE